DFHVTGVQTCALPISCSLRSVGWAERRRQRQPAERCLISATCVTLKGRTITTTRGWEETMAKRLHLYSLLAGAAVAAIAWSPAQIGRASCRERVWGAG